MFGSQWKKELLTRLVMTSYLTIVPISAIGLRVANSPTLSTRQERASQRYDIISSETLADGRNPLEGLAEMVVHLMVNGRPLEALEATVELEDFLADLRADLVSDARRGEPPTPWQPIADALGVSKQAVLQKYGARQLSERLGRVRPGPPPRSDAACEFVFSVNKSFLTTNSPITIPRHREDFVEANLLRRVKGDSVGLTFIRPDGASVAGRLRYSENQGGGYYQLNAPRGAIAARLGESFKVRFAATSSRSLRVELQRLHRLPTAR